MKDSLNDSLKIQLAQIYGYGKSKLNVKIPCVQQQHNSYDCGLFAIANMMEFATNRYSGLTDAHLKFSYVQNKMRWHLKKMSNPEILGTISKTKTRIAKQIEVLSVEIDLLCCCSSPYVKGLGPWIICNICKQWYLQKCEGMDNTKTKTNQMYICKICSVDI